VYLNKKSINQNRVEQHLRVIFNDLEVLHATKKNVYALIKDKRSAGAFLPPKLRRQLRLV
ncbi:MAG: hypothetical protein ACREF7_02720, partial [Candidatus Saccharimonadales bacterium]